MIILTIIFIEKQELMIFIFLGADLYKKKEVVSLSSHDQFP